MSEPKENWSVDAEEARTQMAALLEKVVVPHYQSLEAAAQSLSRMRPVEIPTFPPITPVSHWLSGEASFTALKEAVDELTRAAPEDHDVLIQAFNLAVREVRYIEPHTFLFGGNTYEGNDAWVVVHYAQLVAHVVHVPKQAEKRVITGFARQAPASRQC